MLQFNYSLNFVSESRIIFHFHYIIKQSYTQLMLWNAKGVLNQSVESMG